MKMFQYVGFKKRDNLGGTMNKTLTFLNQVVKENTTIVLGLSGGPDSICLFHMLVNIQKKKKIVELHKGKEKRWVILPV